MDKVKAIVQNIKKHSCDHLIDLVTEDGYNMLHFAVCYKSIQIVQFLIENGASESVFDTHLMLTLIFINTVANSVCLRDNAL